MEKKPGLFERVGAWLEALILDKLVARENPGPVFKWIFKIPILYYKIGFGWLVGWRILLLTTTGRKTGKPRDTPLEYEYDSHSNRYRIAAGWAGKTDWYRNLRACPHVIVQVGRKRFNALAEFASDEEVGRYMMDVSMKHPIMDKVWNRWSDRPLDGSFESYVYAARFFPSVWLKPERA